MAISVANNALSTDAQPLTPHAPGMKSGFCFARRMSPRGKGIPIQNARGAIDNSAINVFIGIERAIAADSKGGSRKR